MLGSNVQIHSTVGRISILVIVVLLLAVAGLVVWKSMGALRNLPRERLSGRQQAVVLLLVASEVVVTALGVLIGYVVFQTGHKGSGMLTAVLLVPLRGWRSAGSWVALPAFDNAVAQPDRPASS